MCLDSFTIKKNPSKYIEKKNYFTLITTNAMIDFQVFVSINNQDSCLLTQGVMLVDTLKKKLLY